MVEVIQIDSDTVFTTKRFGIVNFRMAPTRFDFVNSSSGDVLIPRGTEVAEIRIPTVQFPKGRKKVITPGMLTRSFGLVADYIAANRVHVDFVIGLTHLRMGNLAEGQWHLSVEARPFPEEIYRLIDLGLKDPEIDKEEVLGLEVVRKQALVYQTREEFIKFNKELK